MYTGKSSGCKRAIRALTVEAPIHACWPLPGHMHYDLPSAMLRGNLVASWPVQSSRRPPQNLSVHRLFASCTSARQIRATFIAHGHATRHFIGTVGTAAASANARRATTPRWAEAQQLRFGSSTQARPHQTKQQMSGAVCERRGGQRERLGHEGRLSEVHNMNSSNALR